MKILDLNRKPIDFKKILDLPMATNDADASTIREYIVNLAMRCWQEGEQFSGKRPFGNSGWERELLEPLITHGYIHEDDEYNGRRIIDNAIKELA